MKEKEKIDISEKLANLIRENSKNVKITVLAEFKDEKYELTDEEILKVIAEFKNEDKFSDIQILKGRTRYFFSDDSMSESYARTLARVEDKDLLKLIAETVRENSRIYPRPSDCRTFYKTPYNISEEIFKSVLEEMKEKEEYQDIKITEASNGVPYLYSDEFLEEEHAIALTEWIEVIRKEVP